MKTVFRLPPCPDYDIEGTESWLTDLAAEGLHLAKDGFFLGIGCFEKGEPAAVRYRLEAAEKPTSMWTDDGGLPEDSAVELSRAFGWDYVANRGQFYIYRTALPGALELNTDPAVQALSLDLVCKRQRGTFVGTLTNLLVLCILYPLLFTGGAFLLTVIALRTWLCLFGATLLLWNLGRGLRELWYLHRLKALLQTGGHIDHGKAWRQKAAAYHLRTALRRALTLLWFVLLLLRLSTGVSEEGKIPLAEYTGNPPFLTMEDLAADGGYALAEMGFSNTVEIWSDFLAPVNYDWNEIADLTLPDGRHISGGLYLSYHEARTPALARAIAQEYIRKDRHDGTSLFHESKYEPLPLSPLDVDFAAAYTNDLHFPTLVLQNGNKVMRAYWYQTSEDKLSTDEWAALLAASLAPA